MSCQERSGDKHLHSRVKADFCFRLALAAGWAESYADMSVIHYLDRKCGENGTLSILETHGGKEAGSP